MTSSIHLYYIVSKNHTKSVCISAYHMIKNFREFDTAFAGDKWLGFSPTRRYITKKFVTREYGFQKNPTFNWDTIWIFQSHTLHDIDIGKKNRILGRFQLFQVWMVLSSLLFIFSQVTMKNRWRTDSRSSAVILAIAEKKLEKKNHASTGIKPVCNEAFCINGYGICKDELRIR